MATGQEKITVKFLVDSKNGRVVLADADADFVDILLSFLTLSLGSIVKFLDKQSTLGSLDNLFGSVEGLQAGDMQDKGWNCWKQYMLGRQDSRLAYQLWMLRVNYTKCTERGSYTTGVFVKKGAKFIVTDELQVLPFSWSNTFSIFNKLGIRDRSSLEERRMDLGCQEILELLKLSLISKTPLTDICFKDSDNSRARATFIKQEIVPVKKENGADSESKKIDLGQDGDRNTSFFHKSTILRRKKNKIEALQDESGNWIRDDSQLKSLAIEYFKNLYREEGQLDMAEWGNNGFLQLTHVENLNLRKPVSLEEVKHVLFHMGPTKAPGPDGFQPIFYQNQWSVVGEGLWKLVQETFQSGDIFPDLNATFLVLIPKCPNPISIKQFRPISLCNVAYKTITKLISNRLKELMPKLVMENQSSFIPNRNINDNVIIAQEVLHSMRNKRSGKKWMAIKIDLEKAYDRIRWDYLQHILQDIGLEAWLVKLIMACVSTASMHLLWNGGITEQFKPSRGLRQGDSLSPYLFVLCLEKLAHEINFAVQSKVWNPICLSREGPPLSHLFFADDLFLFAEASEAQARVVKATLKRFCRLSGQKINEAKTRVFYSKNASPRLRRRVSRKLGFAQTSDLGKYLGNQLIHGRVSKDTFKDTMNMVDQRLAAWKAKSLTLAGRTTLAKSVIQATPVYVMQTNKLPANVCNHLDRAAREFIWGRNGDKRKLHLINWETVCHQKGLGGLGLRHTTLFNDALLMKSAWRLVTSPNQLWARVIKAKYCKGDRPWAQSFGPQISAFWRGIGSIWDGFIRAVCWQVGNGERVRFWFDQWVTGAGPLISLAIQQVPEHMLNRTVAWFSNNEGGWDWPKFQQFLPSTICLRIAAMLAPYRGAGEDTPSWTFVKSGLFSTKSAYDYIQRGYSLDDSHPALPIWKVIWGWKGPEKIKFFLWLVAHGRIATKKLCNERNLPMSKRCPRCELSEESTLHAVRDCVKVKLIWEQLIHPSIHTKFFNSHLKQWLLDNLASKAHNYHANVQWKHIFGVATWLIWLARNQEVFHQKSEPMQGLIARIICMAQDCSESDHRGPPMGGLAGQVAYITWEPPADNGLKLNVDGASNQFSGVASAGGVLRDDKGRWKGGFVQNIGICDALQAELWAIKSGLEFLCARGISRCTLETDAWAALDCIHAGAAFQKIHNSLTSAIHRLLQYLPGVTLVKTFREANNSADWMARMAFRVPLGLHFVIDCPESLRNWLYLDLNAVGAWRHVSSSLSL